MLLGEEGLRTPTVLKRVACIAQLLNGLLVFSILRRLGTSVPLALLLTACFGGLTTAAWGIALPLEAFMNAAFWLLLKGPHPLREALAGVALGCAVMIKQYALFAVPALLLASVVPLLEPASKQRPRLAGGRGLQLGLLLAAAPLPYLLFLLGTGLDPIENFMHLATFGSDASGYGAWGFLPMWELLVAGNVGRFLLPAWCLGAWLLLRARSWRSAVLYLAVALETFPLYVRPFDYYVQSALPWAIFIMAEFAHVMGGRFRESVAVTTLVASLIALFLVSVIWTGARHTLDPATSASEQMDLARQLEGEIGASSMSPPFNKPFIAGRELDYIAQAV